MPREAVEQAALHGILTSWTASSSLPPTLSRDEMTVGRGSTGWSLSRERGSTASTVPGLGSGRAAPPGPCCADDRACSRRRGRALHGHRPVGTLGTVATWDPTGSIYERRASIISQNMDRPHPVRHRWHTRSASSPRAAGRCWRVGARICPARRIGEHGRLDGATRGRLSRVRAGRGCDGGPSRDAPRSNAAAVTAAGQLARGRRLGDSGAAPPPVESTSYTAT
jgi:hypothetical protein